MDKKLYYQRQCTCCGAKIAEKKYWRNIIYNDPELNHVPKYRKNLFVDLVTYMIVRNRELKRNAS